MKITCQTCNTDYVDSSPAAEVEPIGCPWCGHTTTAPTEPPDVTLDSLVAAMAALKALGPVPPEIEFFEAFGDVYAMARRGNDREILGRMTRAKLEELKARLRAGEVAR